MSDVIAFIVPPNMEMHLMVKPEMVRDFMDDLAFEITVKQYDGESNPPTAIANFQTEWLITDEPEDIEAFQPAHDCPTCIAGSDQARAYMAEFPGRFIALGNIFYTEVW